jgi:hypothetical protein
MPAAATMVGLLAAICAQTPVSSQEFLIIRRDQDARSIGRFPASVQIVELDDRTLVYGDADRGYRSMPLSQVVGIVAVDALPAVNRTGLLRLADGQSLPGEALSGARAAANVLVWNQSAWLGQMDVPLDHIESVAFHAGARVPDPGEEDVVELSNGDRLVGFVSALGDPLVIDLQPLEPGGERQRVEIGLDRISAVRIVTPPRPASGTRVWLVDGTVVDVDGLVVTEEGVVRLEGVDYLRDAQPKRLDLTALVAAQFDPEGLVPFAALAPRSVEGPSSRYRKREPRTLDDLAPLGLARVELRGPIVARYSLPSVPVVFSAEAGLPPSARSWGDCELVLRSDRREVFRARLNGASPSVAVSVRLDGPELEIEVTEGAHGPIQDHVILRRAMLLAP